MNKKTMLSGYMLRQPNNPINVGEPWWYCDTRVWVLPTLGMAKHRCVESRGFIGSTNAAPFTTVWFVAGEVSYEKKGGIYYTNHPTKLIAKKCMGEFLIPEITEEQLLANIEKHDACDVNNVFRKLSERGFS